ncbi:MAG TPA: hypothetical protein PKW55_00260 [Spirochaetota bacterium]|nr:hypothetical protein [Spirochaetota bacterium]HOM37790.1 hypothetical protein [Spirochaetota bacterium]HPQ49333.1 hypothetical protein [Spirochaetota bacterium]
MKIKLSENAKTILHVVNAILWIWLLIASWSKNEDLLKITFFVMPFIVFFYLLMGIEKRNEVKSPVPLFYPAITLFIVWVVSFYLVLSYRGISVDPSDFILGMHPSMAAALLIFWIGNLLTTALSYVLFFDESVDEKEWNDFLNEVSKYQKLK